MREHNGLDILVLDDEEKLRDMMKIILSTNNENDKIFVTGDIHEAIEYKADLYFLDYTLGNGYVGSQVAEELRNSNDNHLIVHYSSIPIEDLTRKEIGLYDLFLMKPVNLQEIKNVVELTRDLIYPKK